MISHPRYDTLVKTIGKPALNRQMASWTGIVYRATGKDYARASDLISGIGAFKGGGRWNYPGGFRVVYSCTLPELTILESLAYYRRAGIPDTCAMPIIIKAIEVKLSRVLDLTQPQALMALDIAAEDLVNERWWESQDAACEALTQALGRAAYRQGIEGLLVPSAYAEKKGENLIIFPDNLLEDSFLKVLRKRRKTK